MIVYRIPRYIIFLNSMLKYTSKFHSDFALIHYVSLSCTSKHCLLCKAVQRTTDVLEDISRYADNDSADDTRKLISIALSIDGNEGAVSFRSLSYDNLE